MTLASDSLSCLPVDYAQALLIGRIWQPGVGPVLVTVRDSGLYDLSPVALTASALLEMPDPAASVLLADGLVRIGSLDMVWQNSFAEVRDPAVAWLLAPCDLQAIKASGVTFVASMLERVIEEQARGDASRAQAVRAAITAVIGDNLASIVPGSPQAQQLKEVLLAQGVWSQYLEVGIGPDAEIFTKAQPLSALGTGDTVGIHPKSVWNNPEPEIVLAVDSQGLCKGATLGNDVNLRDFEGRSALLLGKAKDNNGACAIGPFIRLFDASFTIDHVRQCELTLHIEGPDGFVLNGSSAMNMISRDPLDLIEHAMGATHQYPDGMMLFLGTMFAPTQDRSAPGQGFTHQVGDVVSVSTDCLGKLVNTVGYSDRIAPWTFGIAALFESLLKR